MDVTIPGQLAEQVRAAYGRTADPRLRELLGALITHLHAFVAETRLTSDEWLAGLEFLTAVGHTCDSERPLLRSGSGPPGDSTTMRSRRQPVIVKRAGRWRGGTRARSG